MKRKKSPLLHRKGGTSTDSSDSSHPKLGVPAQQQPSPAVLHPFFVPASPLQPDDDAEDGEARNSGGSLNSLGSNEALHVCGADENDCGGPCHTPDLVRTRTAIERVQQKIMHTKELIKAEQRARDDNVNEYLKLATNADKQQLQRIKSVFEKKNQKSAQLIAQLQKKMENYNKRIRDLEMHGLPRGVLRDVGQGLKDVGANIRGGISGLSGSVMSKPREFAHLIKNKFGSADNINSITKGPEETEVNIHGSALSTHRYIHPCSTKYTSDEENSSAASESGPTQHTIEAPHPQPPPPPSPHHQHLPVQHNFIAGPDPLMIHALGSGSFDLEPVLHELRSQRDEYQHVVEEIESVKGQIQQESTYFTQALQEERYRYERLEEQMNDLIELHQNEIENLKQGIADMEEKVQYQSEERLRDVHDILDNCQTRISRMEHQQHQHLQQLVTLDAVENSQARALLLKLINIALTVLQVVLLLVATLSNIIMPFLRTRVRTLTTLLLIFVMLAVCHQWPELLDVFNLKAADIIPAIDK